LILRKSTNTCRCSCCYKSMPRPTSTAIKIMAVCVQSACLSPWWRLAGGHTIAWLCFQSCPNHLVNSVQTMTSCWWYHTVKEVSTWAGYFNWVMLTNQGSYGQGKSGNFEGVRESQGKQRESGKSQGILKYRSLDQLFMHYFHNFCRLLGA